MDAVGVSLAAAARGVAGPAVDMVRSWAGAREATVIGQDFAAPAPAAALLNGLLMRALDYDDIHVESGVNVSAVVLPVALAVGEEVGARGTDLLAAAVAGYEVAGRVGAAAPGRFAARGLDATGICGPFAAAAVAGRLWGLSAEEQAAAFGIASARAAGVAAASENAERLQAGFAAEAGVIAADLARRGASGPGTVFEGPSGVFDSLLAGEEQDHGRLVRGLGTEWETLRICMKPHPASHLVLAFMDAGARAGVKWADIEEIVCTLSPAAVGLVAEPRPARLHPGTMRDAQWSLPFAVATAIVGGREGLALFEEDARSDRRVLTLAERIHHETDPALTVPEGLGGRLRVHTRGGRTLDVDEPVNRGHPDRPLDDDEVTEKFLRNARARLDLRAARRLASTLGRLRDLPGADQLGAALRLV